MVLEEYGGIRLVPLQSETFRRGIHVCMTRTEKHRHLSREMCQSRRNIHFVSVALPHPPRFEPMINISVEKAAEYLGHIESVYLPPPAHPPTCIQSERISAFGQYHEHSSPSPDPSTLAAVQPPPPSSSKLPIAPAHFQNKIKTRPHRHSARAPSIA